MMNRRYIGDAELADRMSRFIIAFPYALMALLRGSSLGEEGGHGVSLVQRGILTREELDHMHRHPCWQPHWILDVLRALVVEAHKVPGGKGIVVDEGNKIHGQFVRCFDNGLKRMGDLVGNCVRTGAGGLPVSYDAVVMISFFAFFLLASLVWSASIGWMTPFIVVPASAIIILLIVMGTKLVDPFGTDKVDVPMEAYCATVEAQVSGTAVGPGAAMRDLRRLKARTDVAFAIPRIDTGERHRRAGEGWHGAPLRHGSSREADLGGAQAAVEL